MHKLEPVFHFRKKLRAGSVICMADSVVSVQVENADALVQIDDIVSIEGLDSVIIGPVDLSHFLEHTRRWIILGL